MFYRHLIVLLFDNRILTFRKGTILIRFYMAWVTIKNFSMQKNGEDLSASVRNESLMDSYQYFYTVDDTVTFNY